MSHWLASPDFDQLPTEAQSVVAHLQMDKIPHEGAWFAPTFRSNERLEGEAAARYRGERALSSGIYALLSTDCFSALHRLATDETWHFYAGHPVQLFMIDPNGDARWVMLGPDVLRGQHPQFTIPRHNWQAARPMPGQPDAWSLVGNTLAPGFDYADYEAGDRDALIDAWPAHRDWIIALTRSASRESG